MLPVVLTISVSWGPFLVAFAGCCQVRCFARPRPRLPHKLPRDLRQEIVGVLFFRQRLGDELRDVRPSDLSSKSPRRAVPGNLVVLNLLYRRDHTEVRCDIVLSLSVL